MTTGLIDRAAERIEAGGFVLLRRIRRGPQAGELAAVEWRFDPRLQGAERQRARKICAALALAWCRDAGLPGRVVHFVWGVCVRLVPAPWAT